MSTLLVLLGEATRVHQPTIDEERIGLMVPTLTAAAYRHFLARVYGFEAPVEAAFARTPKLDDLVELRARTKTRLLRSDLTALGDAMPECLPAITMPVFAHIADALGWMYVVERNTLLHGLVRRHLEATIPHVFQRAGAYVGAYERVAGSRWRELGDVLRRHVRVTAHRDRVIDAAHQGFRALHTWLSEARPQRRAA